VPTGAQFEKELERAIAQVHRMPAFSVTLSIDRSVRWRKTGYKARASDERALDDARKQMGEESYAQEYE